MKRPPLTFTGTTRKKKLVENKLDEENDLFLCVRLSLLQITLFVDSWISQIF